MSHIALEKLLIKLEKLHPKYIDLSLNRILKLLNKLDNPHLKIPPAIHIAGTNGKGSVLMYINEILKESGYRSHYYISPHLENITERFVISGKTISKQKLYKTLKYIEKVNKKNPITFFEIITATAFYLFNKTKADFVLLETGLGGRLDATNVIYNPLINIITPISFDHTEYLGSTLKKITNEKLGIIKKHSTVIIGKQNNDVLKYISKKIYNFNNKKIFYKKDFKIINIKNKKFDLLINNKKKSFNKPSLLGNHQIENASLAIICCYELIKKGYKIKNKNINCGLTQTLWPGRLERIKYKKLLYNLDGAHNVAGAKVLSKYIEKNFKKIWIIFGMINNKNIYSFLKILKNNIYGIIALEIPDQKNTFETSQIHGYCKKLNILCVEKKNIKLANKYLINNNIKNVIVTGSLYLVGKVRKSLN